MKTPETNDTNITFGHILDFKHSSTKGLLQGYGTYTEFRDVRYKTFSLKLSPELKNVGRQIRKETISCPICGESLRLSISEQTKLILNYGMMDRKDQRKVFFKSFAIDFSLVLCIVLPFILFAFGFMARYSPLSQLGIIIKQCLFAIGVVSIIILPIVYIRTRKYYITASLIISFRSEKSPLLKYRNTGQFLNMLDNIRFTKNEPGHFLTCSKDIGNDALARTQEINDGNLIKDLLKIELNRRSVAFHEEK